MKSRKPVADPDGLNVSDKLLGFQEWASTGIARVSSGRFGDQSEFIAQPLLLEAGKVSRRMEQAASMVSETHRNACATCAVLGESCEVHIAIKQALVAMIFVFEHGLVS